MQLESPSASPFFLFIPFEVYRETKENSRYRIASPRNHFSSPFRTIVQNSEQWAIITDHKQPRNKPFVNTCTVFNHSNQHCLSLDKGLFDRQNKLRHNSWDNVFVDLKSWNHSTFCTHMHNYANDDIPVPKQSKSGMNFFFETTTYYPLLSPPEGFAHIFGTSICTLHRLLSIWIGSMGRCDTRYTHESGFFITTTTTSSSPN